MTKQKIQTVLMVEPELKQKAEEIAKARGMSFSALVRMLIRDFIDQETTWKDEVAEIKRRLDEIERRL